MDKMRVEHIKEMERLRDAIRRSRSPYLRRDYSKALRRMSLELKEYDSYKRRSKQWQS